MSEIASFRLVTGDEIIGRVEEILHDRYILDKPRVLRPMMQGPKQYGIALLPFFFANPDGRGTIYKAHVLGEPETTAVDLAKAYTQEVSGIEIASSSILMEGVK